MMPGNFIPAGGIRPGVGAVMPGLMAAPSANALPTAMNPDTTGYFGNLSPNVSEEVVTAVLGCSGGFKRLKRPVDPSTGKPKAFALVEFESVDDLNRAFRVFQDFVLDQRHLNIKIEGGRDEISKMEAGGEGDLKIYEMICRVLIGKKMTAGGSMEWLEKRISREKERERKREKEREREREEKKQPSHPSGQQPSQPSGELARDRRDSRQRNYSDLLVDDFQFTKTAPSLSANSDASLSLKERERRWEGKSRELERELRRDLEKDADRAKRHEKETFALQEHISNYSDGPAVSAGFADFGSLGREVGNSSATVPFFVNREKWRNLRKQAGEKEEEIFGECLRIRAEMQANSLQSKIEKQREFIEKRLPTEREELFAFPVDWQLWNGDLGLKFKELCRERVAAYFKNAKQVEFYDKIGDFLFEQVSQKQPASAVTAELRSEPAFLAVCSEEPGPEAELIIMIIWRWLIYFTSVDFK